MTTHKKNIAIFASGNGSNFEALTAACNKGIINATVRLLVCDNPQAKVIKRAKHHQVHTFSFNPKSYTTKADFEQEIVNLMDSLHIDLVCLAGYMRIVGDTLLNRYEGRIINIHPALLPAFKGPNAIDKAFNFGVKVFGVTVHMVDKTVDGGPIIAQRGFEYHGNDRDEVEGYIHRVEHELFPEAVNDMLTHLKTKQ